MSDSSFACLELKPKAIIFFLAIPLSFQLCLFILLEAKRPIKIYVIYSLEYNLRSFAPLQNVYYDTTPPQFSHMLSELKGAISSQIGFANWVNQHLGLTLNKQYEKETRKYIRKRNTEPNLIKFLLFIIKDAAIVGVFAIVMF